MNINMVVTMENLHSHCRTCLNELRPRTKLDIHATPNVAKWLVVCTSLEVEKNDGYPAGICASCYNKIQAAYEFRVMCIKSMREIEAVINAFPKLEIDRLEWDGASSDVNSSHWMDLAHKEEITFDFPAVEHKIEAVPPQPPETNVADCVEQPNSPADAALDEQEIDHNDIFSGIVDDSTDSDSAPEQNRLEEVEEVAKKKIENKPPPAPKRGRKPKEEDFSMPAYIKTPEIYHCDKCNKKFFKKDRFEAHVRIHAGLKPYPCKQCERSYSKSSHLKIHMLDIHSDNKAEFKCEHEGCDKVFRRKQTLRVHCRIKHSEVKVEPKIFICEECGKTFRNISALRDHRFKHTGEEYPYKCDKCTKGYISERTFREHMMRHAGIKNFVCPHCGLKKTTKSELRIHINYHTKERQWPCPLCTSVFNSSANLGLHNRIVHKGIRRFKCKYCDQSFGKAETLKHHEMRHTGEKPHGCDICGKRFIQVVALRAHLKTHNKAT